MLFFTVNYKFLFKFCLFCSRSSWCSGLSRCTC